MNQPAELRRHIKEGVNEVNHIPKGKGKENDFISLYVACTILVQILYQIQKVIKTINPRVRRATYHQAFKH